MAYDDIEEIIEYSEQKSFNFDLRGFIFKLLKYWKLFLICIVVGLFIAHYFNVRKQNIYRLDSLITINNDQNPFFTANTSISFNWGGVSNKVGSILTEIKTRSHNELVVDSLEYYKQYLEEGKYHLIDIYKDVPFVVETDKSKPQVLGKPLGVKIIDSDTYELFYEFETDRVQCQFYDSKQKIFTNVDIGEFRQTYKFDQIVNLPFFNGKVSLRPRANIPVGKTYFVKYLNFDFVVNRYKNDIKF